jgi:hypothetical protein
LNCVPDDGVSGAVAAGPHAVTTLAGVINGSANPVYCYDADGNMLAGAGRLAAWTSFNMVAQLVQGSTTLAYAYDAEHSRIKQVQSGGTALTTYYLNDPASGIASEKAVGASTTTWSDYLFADGARVGVRYATGGTVSWRYFVADPLTEPRQIAGEVRKDR